MAKHGARAVFGRYLLRLHAVDVTRARLAASNRQSAAVGTLTVAVGAQPSTVYIDFDIGDLVGIRMYQIYCKENALQRYA